jgi:hypothetical protein
MNKFPPFEYPISFTPQQGHKLDTVFNLMGAFICWSINIFIWYKLVELFAHAVKLGLQ